MNSATDTATNTAMNSEMNTQSKNKNSSSSLMKPVESKIPSFGGISLPEIAILGAAGFVLWKNRSKIQAFLENNGINVPTFLSGDLSQLVQTGASAIHNRGENTPATSNMSNNNKNATGSNTMSSQRKHDA